jgi:hypothetical protein
MLGGTAGKGNHGDVHGHGQNKRKHRFQLLNESLIPEHFSHKNGQNIREKSLKLTLVAIKAAGFCTKHDCPIFVTLPA